MTETMFYIVWAVGGLSSAAIVWSLEKDTNDLPEQFLGGILVAAFWPIIIIAAAAAVIIIGPFALVFMLTKKINGRSRKKLENSYRMTGHIRNGVVDSVVELNMKGK